MKSGGLVFLLVGLLAVCAVVHSASQKPGRCPFYPAVVRPPCVKECRNDFECRGPKKCCPVMCSMKCVNPDFSDAEPESRIG
ncbi:omwaprin-a-like [Elgaria multicarinata webbii]|uniref:omwaprin-a-like n=1 Tax=Elgaria multicarinata webbii TaxID=159646 RepID=UPI002FCCFA3B